ncbi:hypothetical protein [Bradyrhizobium lablabi]|uniref:hypothetical protein n=1 Tax=Bradyrhizobium lablabi TaxID=722472 RepID=UPI001BA8FF6F|nr:hypothetical protein [Bradyrhizobium lablabi]MBR0697226.1 hypothetical protein [Bradyrhizobium lablabi]
MLPGLRFLLAAIVLATSILVFGLGAAALLRAAHEEFANVPARWAPSEPQFVQQVEPPPTLAMLSIEPPPSERPPEPLVAEPPPEAPEAAAPAEVEQLAAVKADEARTIGPIEADVPADETAPAREGSSAVPAPVEAEIRAAPDDADKVAAIADSPPATVEPAAAEVASLQVVEPALPQLSPEASQAATRIATLGGPEVTVARSAPAKATNAKPDRSLADKRARRARELRRIAQAQAAQQAALQQQPVDLFGQPINAPATTRR